MKFVPIQCPCCNANINADIEKKVMYCGHCGTQIYIDDEVKRYEYTHRIIDDAEIKRAEAEKMRAEVKIKKAEAEVKKAEIEMMQAEINRKTSRGGDIAAVAFGFLLFVFLFIMLIIGSVFGF